MSVTGVGVPLNWPQLTDLIRSVKLWSGGSVNDNNRLGSWIGAMGRSNGDQGPDLAPSVGDLLTAELLGRRLAEITARRHGRPGYVTRRASLA